MAKEVKAGGEATLDEIAAQVFAALVGPAAAENQAGSDEQLRMLATRAYRVAEAFTRFRKDKQS